MSDPTSGPLTLTPGVGSGVAHVPAACDENDAALGAKSAGIPMATYALKCTATRLEVRLISSDVVDDLQARVPIVVGLGTLVHAPRAWNSAA